MVSGATRQGYKQLSTARREYAKNPPRPQYQWNADQVHDYVLFMGKAPLAGAPCLPNGLLLHFAGK